MESEKPSNSELVTLNPIRVETALSRYPVHRLAKKGSIDINIRDGNAASVETQWEVDYSKKHGQPGPLAYKLDTLIINRRIEEARRPLSRLLRLGSLSDICKELGLADSGKNRADIKKSLFQNAFAGITTKTKYKLADGTERSLEAGFTRYSIILTGEELPDGRKADSVHVILNDVFMQVINGAMTRPLDYDYLKSLPPAPQRFYELLSYQMYAALKYDRPRAKLVYSDFCAHAPQTRHTDWNRVRSQMHKVHRPHRESGYVADINFNQTVDANGNPDWIMLYLPGPKAQAEFRAFTKRGGPSVLEIETFDASPSPPDELSELEKELTQRGVSIAAAKNLTCRHAEERIRFQIECVDWLVEKKPEKIDDRAAYLVTAIEKDFAAPSRFVTKAERQRRLEVKQAKEREEATARSRQLEADARERAEQLAAKAYREALTPDELKQLEAEALAQAGPSMRDTFEQTHQPAMRRLLLSSILEQHIRKIVQRRQIEA